MSNELSWKRWTPDDLAPPLSEFTPAKVSPAEPDVDVGQPELSEEEKQAQMLAQLQMQAHEQGYTAGLNGRPPERSRSGAIRKVWRKD